MTATSTMTTTLNKNHPWAYTKAQIEMTVADAMKLYDGVYNELLEYVNVYSEDKSFNFIQAYSDAINDMQELYTPHMYNPIIRHHISLVTKKIAELSVMYWSKKMSK